MTKKELLEVNISRPAADSVLSSASLEWTVDGDYSICCEHVVLCCYSSVISYRVGIWMKSNQPGRILLELFIDGKNITFSNGNTAQVMLAEKVQ